MLHLIEELARSLHKLMTMTGIYRNKSSIIFIFSISLILFCLSSLWAQVEPFDSQAAGSPARVCESYLVSGLDALDSNPSLTSWSQRIQAASFRNLTLHAAEYVGASQEGHVKMLQAMGYRFSGEVVVPETKSVLAQIKDGKSFRPVRVVSKGWLNKKYLFLHPGDAIPSGFKPLTGILPNKLFAKALAERMFPIGESELISKDYSTVFDHGLAHLTSFLEFPEFGEALYKVFQAASPQQIDGHDFFWARISNIVEYMSLFKTESYAQALSEIGLPSTAFTGEVAKVDFLTKHLSGLPGHKSLEQIADRLFEIYEANVLHIGGVVRDVPSRHAELSNPSHGARTIAVHYVFMAAKQARKDGSLDAKTVAKLAAIILNFSRISAEQYVAQGAAPKIDKSSWLSTVVRDSGIWHPFDLMYRVFSGETAVADKTSIVVRF